MAHVVPFHLKKLHAASKAEVNSLIKGQASKNNYMNESNFYGYKQAARTAAEEPQIPLPKLFRSLTLTGSTAPDSDLPTLSECAVHLELLEVFYKLRQDIIKSRPLDDTFGVLEEKKTVFRKSYNTWNRTWAPKQVQLKDATWPTRRRKKWSYFLVIAVGRFKVWARKMDAFLKAPDRGTLEPWAEQGEFSSLPFLPPLDVLMVWHAFLLNPHDYDRGQLRYRLASLSRLPFPWKAVHDAVNSRYWTYTLPKASEEWTRTYAGLEPDLRRYLVSGGGDGTWETGNGVRNTLTRYGQGNVHIMPLGELLDMPVLSLRDAMFLTILRQTVADKHADRALVDNVQRQAAFVDKMHLQLWIRSPAAGGTLGRAVGRYDRFLRLFALYPGKMLVPTLDIDVAWHTHQCSAQAYAESVKRRTGVFINHDDKLGKEVLHGGMDETKDLFFVRFGEEYERCLCWDCEATLSAIEEADDDESSEGPGVSSLVQKVKDEVQFFRCVEICRRAGKNLPKWPANVGV